MAKPLERGIPNPPLAAFRVSNHDLMMHHFQRVPIIDNAGAYRYAYTTFGAQAQALVGTGTGMKRQGLRAVTPPLVSVPTVTRQGTAFTAGQLNLTPVTDEYGVVTPGGL